ncbi:KH domain-containing protein [Bdellovibrio bacteriovorus]|uniref:KH domain-containing protein n=1 Tax=Bdellovibrio bacteriovorus TaxID=959 RepID=UPI003A7F6B37
MSGLKEIKVIRKRPEISPNQDQDRENGRNLLETLIRGLVDYPDTVSVTYMVGDKTTVYKVECDQKCLGQVIGSKGKNIGGIRAVISATLARKGIRAIVEIPYFVVEA